MSSMSTYISTLLCTWNVSMVAGVAYSGCIILIVRFVATFKNIIIC